MFGMVALWGVSPAFADPRSDLKAVALSAGSVPDAPVSTSAFSPATGSQKASNKFPGRLILEPTLETARANALRNGGDRLGDTQRQVDVLPAMVIDLVQSGDDLIPLERGLVQGEHPYWTYFVGVGKVWDEPDDAGWTRAVLPFALQERNQNCTHNGLMSFVFRADGAVSNVYYQVGSETCTYFQADLWGLVTARTGTGSGAAAEAVSDYRAELARRLPVKPLSALAQDFPGTDISAFQPPSLNQVTVFGLVVDGINYRDGCETRFGRYVLCDELHLPSYSTAKSAYAGLAVMRMAQQWPDFPNQSIASLVPACDLPDGRWDDVTVDDALDMTTGNYTASVYMSDEDEFVGDFLSQPTHAGKVQVACEQYSRRGIPGDQWVYHTSDTYLVIAAMDAWLAQQGGQRRDSLEDIVVADLWKPLTLSPVSQSSQRTADGAAQAFGGLGLTFLSDDVARIGQFLGPDQGFVQGQPVFASAELDQALFRVDGAPPEHKATALFAYSNGFWGGPGQAWAGCQNDTWLPHMSGFGGITIALLPNGMTYYVFADSGQFQWAAAAGEANQMRAYCN